MTDPSAWEVWNARFDYDNGSGYKYRPVIVVGLQNDEMLVMIVTSSSNKLKLKHDYHLRDWREAGLNKPSIARIDCIAKVPSWYLGSAGRIGKLSEYDAARSSETIRQKLEDKQDSA